MKIRRRLRLLRIEAEYWVKRTFIEFRFRVLDKVLLPLEIVFFVLRVIWLTAKKLSEAKERGISLKQGFIEACFKESFKELLCAEKEKHEEEIATLREEAERLKQWRARLNDFRWWAWQLRNFYARNYGIELDVAKLMDLIGPTFSDGWQERVADYIRSQFPPVRD